MKNRSKEITSMDVYSKRLVAFCGFYQNLLLLCSPGPSILCLTKFMHSHHFTKITCMLKREFLSEIAIKLLQLKLISY